jgi:hypothetical protein
MEDLYKRLLEEKIITVDSLACYDPKELDSKIIKEALKRCKAKMRTLTPKPIKGIPYIVYCVDPKCLSEQIIEITKERLELEHQ